MRALVLGALIFASFGLTASAAESRADVKAADHHARQPACHLVTADRKLRLLRDILAGRAADRHRTAGDPSRFTPRLDGSADDLGPCGG